MFILLLACAAAPGPGGGDTADTRTPEDPTADWVAGDGPLVTVSGRAFVFGPSTGLSLAGATVSVLEAPGRSGEVAEDGRFSLEVESGAPLSFVLTQEGFATVQSAAIPVGEGGVADVGFQVPDEGTVALMAAAAQVDIDAERCQVATTVSSAASEGYGGAGVGEPGAVVELLPSLPEGARGPIYFDYLSDSFILPDPDLTATTIDGGVLFGNVPSGEFTLRATKEGVVFSDAVVRCRPGMLVNAAPPHGIEFVR